MLEPAVFLHLRILGAGVGYRAGIGFPPPFNKIQREEADPGETQEIGRGMPGENLRPIVGGKPEGEEPGVGGDGEEPSQSLWWWRKTMSHKRRWGLHCPTQVNVRYFLS